MTVAVTDQWVFPGTFLDHVVDGDTFYAKVHREMDFGFHLTCGGTATIKFRLKGCNAAPVSTESGHGAADALYELLKLGPFTLQSVGPYKYGDEWMAVVTLADGRDVTTEMIRHQWAAAWDGTGAQPLPPWPRTVS